MSKPDWTALAGRYGAQEGFYSQPRLVNECQECERRRGELLCENCHLTYLVLMTFDKVMPRDQQSALDTFNRDRAHHDAGAAEDGQATVRLALAFAPAVALIIAFGLLVAATFGAAWIDGAWLAPFAGLR